MENLVGAPTGIEPASPAIQADVLTTTPQCPSIQADVLTTTPQHPGTNSVEFALSHSTMDYWWNRGGGLGGVVQSLTAHTWMPTYNPQARLTDI